MQAAQAASRAATATRRHGQEIPKGLSELKEEIAAVRTELKDMEIRLTIRLGCMMATAIAIVAALVKLL